MITGKKIVLTGANSGIGLETLKLLAVGDNKILAVDLHTDNIEKFDRNKVIPMVCDVSSAQGVDAIFATALERMGGIDIFYANAAVLHSYYHLAARKDAAFHNDPGAASVLSVLVSVNYAVAHSL